jgi:hypothetical protein
VIRGLDRQHHHRFLCPILELTLVLGLTACGRTAPIPSLPAASEWELGAPMLRPRSEMPAVELDGVIYVPGGFSGPVGTDDLEGYRVDLDRWTRLASMPAGRHHLMAAAHDGKLYVFGGSVAVGWSASASVWRYDPARDAWEELDDMPEPRMSGAAVTIGDTIYVVGGVGGGDGLLAFDPNRGSWRTHPGPAQPREHTAAVAYRGELWLIGGRWSGDGELRSVEIFDPAAPDWREGPALSVARGGFAAEVVGDRIVVAGGEVIQTGREALASVEVYDPAVGSWVPGPDLAVAVHGVDAAVSGGRYFLLGGSDQPAGIRNEGRVQIYAP